MGKIIDKTWIWDGIKDEAELIKKTIETLRTTTFGDKYHNDAEKILNDKDAMGIIMPSVLFFDEFVLEIIEITMRMNLYNDTLNKIVKEWRIRRKDSFYRNTLFDDLQAISEKEKLSKEIENKLITEGKATKTKYGNFLIFHPLIIEIVDEMRSWGKPTKF